MPCMPMLHPRYTLLNSWTDDKGCFVLADSQHCNVTFRVTCLYAPNHNPDRDNFLVFCSSKIDPLIPTLVCGDFNTVPDQSLDRHGSHILDTCTAALLSFVTVELLIFGSLSTPPLPFPGLDWMVLFLPRLTSLIVLMLGFISCNHVTYWLVCFPTLLSLFPSQFPVVLAIENLTS